jgi:acetyl esterase/lipase
MTINMTRRELMAGGGTLLAIGLLATTPLSRVLAASSTPDLLLDVDPELRPAAEHFIKLGTAVQDLTPATLAEHRAGGDRAPLRSLPGVPFEQRQIPARGKTPATGIYIINARAGSARPGILHTHGGGYVTGHPHNVLYDLQHTAKELDATIVSVDYGLAPETRYATSIEQNYAGLKWMHDHAAEIGVDRARIVVMGESAGGGHAAILAIVARDRGEVPVCFQCLVYPMLDDRTGSTRPVPPHIGRLIWTAQNNRFGWNAFLGQTPGGMSVPVIAVPARCKDLKGLPPAFIGVGSIDLFVDEDVEYARRLIEAGVPTQLVVVPGGYHGFDGLAADTSVAKAFNAAKMDALRKAFAA